MSAVAVGATVSLAALRKSSFTSDPLPVGGFIFGAYDQRTGVFSQPKLSNLLSLNHHPSWEGGIMEAECATLLTSFFKTKR